MGISYGRSEDISNEGWHPEARDLRRIGARERLSILLVDDDTSCLASLESLLCTDGHHTFAARHAEEALACARALRTQNQRLDLSILDFHLPDLSGIQVYQLLGQELPGLAAVFVSGDPSKSVEAEVRRVGGLALVRKPLDLARVRGAILHFERGDGFFVA